MGCIPFLNPEKSAQFEQTLFGTVAHQLVPFIEDGV